MRNSRNTDVLDIWVDKSFRRNQITQDGVIYKQKMGMDIDPVRSEGPDFGVILIRHYALFDIPSDVIDGAHMTSQEIIRSNNLIAFAIDYNARFGDLVRHAFLINASAIPSSWRGAILLFPGTQWADKNGREYFGILSWNKKHQRWTEGFYKRSHNARSLRKNVYLLQDTAWLS